MTEPTINQTGIGPATTGDETPDLASYRVSGHLPLTLTVAATSGDAVTGAVTATVADVFTDLGGAALNPDLYAIGAPELVEQPAGADQPGRYRIEVTVYGSVDVAADDPADAIVVAEETLIDHLGRRIDVTADWTFAVCDDVTPLDNGGSTTQQGSSA
jgi:hypothetical protein